MAAAADTAHGADAATAHGGHMSPDRILDSLWLGPAPATNPDYLRILREAGVTHVVNCTEDAPFPDHICDASCRFRLAVKDEPGADIASSLDAAVDFIRDAVAGGGVVYVHCAMGVSRSSTVVLAYRVKHLGETLRTAFDASKECRPVISPNKGFFAVLVALEKRVRDGESTMTFDDFYTMAKLKQDMQPWFQMGLIDAADCETAVAAHGGNVAQARKALENQVRTALG